MQKEGLVMVVRECESAEEFLADYKEILIQQEAVNQLILFNAGQKRGTGLEKDEMFGAVIAGDTTVITYCNIKPYHLVLNIVQQEDAIPAVTVLAEFIADKKILINGVTARNDICQSFIEHYTRLTGFEFEEKMGMDIMEIRAVNDIKPSEGTQRLATDMDIKLIADWMIRFQMEALMTEMDYEAALNKAENFVRENKLYLFENEENIPVTMAAIARKLDHGVAIAYVYTPAEFRGRGYAATNMYYLSKKLLDAGNEYCSLYVDKKNPLSNRAYEKVGYTILEDSYNYQLLI